DEVRTGCSGGRAAPAKSISFSIATGSVLPGNCASASTVSAMSEGDEPVTDDVSEEPINAFVDPVRLMQEARLGYRSPRTLVGIVVRSTRLVARASRLGTVISMAFGLFGA